ncbi:MAG: hypothetical protein ACRBG0_20945 [Lewinella sp.]|jgi:uncharacterized damage-inducible protein DinB|uniref:hypothetical protein n=1 Tax=Lewinella sp. TaxID=2004506 RepID=UPI003D6BD25D
MQQNDLEKFILDNRDAFDDARPSLKLWAAIEKDLNEEEAPSHAMRNRRPWYQVAATVLILLTAGGFGGAFLTQQTQQPTAQTLIEDVAPEFAEMEQYYNQRIKENYARLTTHTQDPEIDADLQQLDNAMAELREDLTNAPSGREEMIVQQLIESYRLKLQILERILERIENIDNSITTPDNNSNETSI